MHNTNPLDQIKCISLLYGGNICLNVYLQACCIWGFLHPALQLQDLHTSSESSVDRTQKLRNPCASMLICLPTMRGSTSTATTFLAFSSSRKVRLPVPGPISKTVSVDLMPALSTIDWTTIGFFRICCPLPLWNWMPACIRGHEQVGNERSLADNQISQTSQTCEPAGCFFAGLLDNTSSRPQPRRHGDRVSGVCDCFYAKEVGRRLAKALQDTQLRRGLNL